MRSVFSFILIFYTVTGLAQHGYSVTYRYDDRYFPITFDGQKRSLPALKDRLIFNDSLSFCYRIPDGGDPLRKKTIVGEKLVHHALIYNARTKYYYSEVAWPKGKQEYLISDTLKNENWLFYNDSKEILGFRCRPALRVSEKNDSTLVWFTDSIPKPFGPFMYLGFPGLVLEVYEQQYGTHLIAAKIESGFYQVLMPKEGIIISPEDFRKLKR
jgi:GLPGLI family protein